MRERDTKRDGDEWQYRQCGESEGTKGAAEVVEEGDESSGGEVGVGRYGWRK